MKGCLNRIAGTLAILAAGALVTRLLPLGSEPRTPAEARYISNALEMRHMLNDHPVSRAVSGLLVWRISVSDMRHVPGSCTEANPDGPGLEDTVATVTDHTFFGIPLSRYQVSCAGNAITRGRKNWIGPSRPSPTRPPGEPPERIGPPPSPASSSPPAP